MLLLIAYSPRHYISMARPRYGNKDALHLSLCHSIDSVGELCH